VNLINSPAVAKAFGLVVQKSSVAIDSPYTELIEVDLIKGSEEIAVAGTFLGSQPRIVHIAGHNVETNVSGRFLFVENDDRPGMVGTVGTLLGAASVNIANMALSRTKDHSRAVTVIEVDSEPPVSLLDALRATPGILRVLTMAF
jgi:D-3-phosphoglycerate dehydrogenase